MVCLNHRQAEEQLTDNRTVRGQLAIPDGIPQHTTNVLSAGEEGAAKKTPFLRQGVVRMWDGEAKGV